MAEPQETSAPGVYTLLAELPNLAVEQALLEALPDLEPELRPLALDTLIERGRDRGVIGLVAGFGGYDAGLQELVLARVKGLFAGARLGVAHERVEVRLGAVELIRRSGDTRLAYLLAGALCQPCHKTRAVAGSALHDLTADYLRRRAAAGRTGADLAGVERDGDLLARALRRAIDGWDLHFRVEVLTTAMWMSDRLEDELLAKAASARSRFARAVHERLASPDDAGLAGFALRALQSPQLRSEVAKRIAACTQMDFVRGLIAESWLLADPTIARECVRIRRWAWLEGDADAVLALPPAEAAGAVRLIAASGLTPEAKVAAYGRLLAAGTEEVQRAAFWRLAALRAQSADALLRGLAQRSGGTLSAMARRELRRRARGRDQPAGDSAERQVAPDERHRYPFDAFWQAFDDLDDDARRAEGSRLTRGCPDLAVRLRGKLASGQPADRTRGLTIVRMLGQTKLLEEQVYRLANDPDPVTRSHAVAMLADLDGPVARRIVSRTLHDPDARVQSNAIETLDRLPVPAKEAQLTPILESTHHRVRATAVAALLKMRAEVAADVLLDMLSAPSQAHRISALWVVERLGLSSLMQRLEEMAESDPDDRVRSRARRVLGGLPAWSTPIGVSAAQEDQP